MNKTEAQQILDNCTTHKRYRCPLTNELHDVIQINASAINDATQHHSKLLHLIRALRYLYPQIKYIARVNDSLHVTSMFDEVWRVDTSNQAIALGLHVPTIIVNDIDLFDNKWWICDNQQTDKPFIDVNEEPQALKQFIVDVTLDNGGTAALMCCALNHGYKWDTTVDSISKLEDFKVGMHFWLDESSMQSFATDWRLCEVTYIRQDVIFYKHVDDNLNEDFNNEIEHCNEIEQYNEIEHCNEIEQYMIADSVLLQCGRAEPVEVDWTQKDLDVRWTRPVSNSGKVIVKMKSAGTTLCVQAHRHNWKPKFDDKHGNN